MKKPKRQTTFKEDAGKIIIDIGKLVFGSVFLGGVLRGEIPHIILVIGGLIVAIMFCLIGLFLGSKEKQIGENGNSPVK